MKDFRELRGKLEYNFPLGLKTTWRVGGDAQIFVEPKDSIDLFYLLELINILDIPLYVLGRGSNLLIDDSGVPGVTLYLGSSFNYIKVEEECMRIGATTPMPAVAKYVSKLGFTGYEHLIGIPGSIGAGIVMNAGKGTGNDLDMRNILHSVSYITRDLNIENKNVGDLELNYRSSCLKNSPNIVTEAVFSLEKKLTRTEIETRQKSILAERREKFPLQMPNSGSVFKKPYDAPPAGKLIELAGLKGYRIGDAQVSNVHANFIVNMGSATSQDIKNLMSEIVDKVLRVHGVQLEREVVFWPEQMNWIKR